MTPTQAAWLAGIVDGEGCITITRQRPGNGGRKNWAYRLYIRVSMCSELTVERIKEITGRGSVHTQDNGRWSRSWVWCVGNRDAVAVLQQIRPYMLTKADEADLGLEWGRLPLSPRGGSGGGNEVPETLLAERHRLFEALKDAKPSARFRRGNADARDPVRREELQREDPEDHRPGQGDL